MAFQKPLLLDGGDELGDAHRVLIPIVGARVAVLLGEHGEEGARQRSASPGGESALACPHLLEGDLLAVRVDEAYDWNRIAFAAMQNMRASTVCPLGS
jgi:hypothetical protein